MGLAMGCILRLLRARIVRVTYVEVEEFLPQKLSLKRRWPRASLGLVAFYNA